MKNITHSKETESVCPVCLKRIKAIRLQEGDDVFMVKECQDHGLFKTVIWRGKPSMDVWKRPKEPVHPKLCYGVVEKGCPFDCGLCVDHEQSTCSVLLEVTNRCNLNCAVCFADSGRGEANEPSLEMITWLLNRYMAAAGPSNLQLSGGEPTLRNDLPEIVDIARQVGYSFIQVNSNGLRLASDINYVRRLSEAGLTSVFLQFDGVDDEINRLLRGKELLEQKIKAIRNCGENGIGIVLVPTIVKNINTDSVGAIVKQAVKMIPTVRGVHFQPVSYFGRFPYPGSNEKRFTLPELMRCLEEQTDGLIKTTDFSPPGCEHEHCSFHASYMYMGDGILKPLGDSTGDSCCLAGHDTGGAKKTIEIVSRRWTLPSTAPSANFFPLIEDSPCCGVEKPSPTDVEEPIDLDLFLQEIATRSFTISAMAFQDADNLDIERLRGCCISVISPDGRLIPFCAYNLTGRDGKSLYRNEIRPALQ